MCLYGSKSETDFNSVRAGGKRESPQGSADLPVSSSELAPGSNGILSQCGEVSELHQYTYGTKDMGVPEKGITLALKEKTAVHANLLDCGDCIQDIYVYDA